MWDVKVGMKIVCLGIPVYTTQPLVYPIKGQIYTVREVTKCLDEYIGIQLLELPDQIAYFEKYKGYHRVSWEREHFRPLSSVDKGMEVLRSILVNPRAKVTGFEQRKRRKVKVKS